MDEERGLTIGEIFKVIFKRVWWVVGVTVACLLVAVLATFFWYNANSKYYSVTYTVTYPDSDKGVYPNGTAFVSKDLISLGLLESVRSSDEKYSGEGVAIDVWNMYKNDDISISRDTDEKNTIKLTLKVKAKYFHSDEQATAFIRDVASYPATIVASMIEHSDYSAYLDAYGSTSDYADQLNLLTEQKRFILSTYDELIKLHGPTYTVKLDDSTERSLSSYRLEAERAFTDYEAKSSTVSGATKEEENVVVTYTLIPDSTRAKLEDEITVNRFVLNAEDYIKAADNKVKRLGIEIENLEARIAAQQAIGGSGDAYNQTISKLTDEKKLYEIELDDVLKTLSAISGTTVTKDDDISHLSVDEAYQAANSAFRDKMDACKNTLKTMTERVKSVRIKVYSDDTKVTFSGNKIAQDGGINIFIAAILGAILGFVAVSVVICIIDVPKYKREKYGEPVPESADGGEGGEPAADAESVQTPDDKNAD